VSPLEFSFNSSLHVLDEASVNASSIKPKPRIRTPGTDPALREDRIRIGDTIRDERAAPAAAPATPSGRRKTPGA
jgi:hypothetical protein